MANRNKELVGKFEPLRIDYDVVVPSARSWMLVITQGSSYCVYGKGHRHQFVGVDFDQPSVAHDAHCSACRKTVTLE